MPFHTEPAEAALQVQARTQAAPQTGATQAPASVARQQLDSALVQGVAVPHGLFARARATGRTGALGLVAVVLLVWLVGRRVWGLLRWGKVRWGRLRPSLLWGRAGEVTTAEDDPRRDPRSASSAGASSEDEDAGPESWRSRLPQKPRPAPIPLPPQVVEALNRVAARRAAMETEPRPEAEAAGDVPARARRGVDVWIGR